MAEIHLNLPLGHHENLEDKTESGKLELSLQSSCTFKALVLCDDI